MTEQTSLLEHSAKLRNDGKETSRLAGMKNMPKSGSQRWKVLQLIYTQGPKTDDEIAFDLQLNPNTVRPRRVELVEGGWIEEAEVKRQNQGGNPCTVWRLTTRAKRELAS